MRYAFTPVRQFVPRQSKATFEITPEFCFVSYDSPFSGSSLREMVATTHEEWRAGKQTVIGDLEMNALVRHANYVLLYRGEDESDEEQVAKRVRFCLAAVRLLVPTDCYGRVVFHFKEGENRVWPTSTPEEAFVLPKYEKATFDEDLLPRVSEILVPMSQAFKTRPNRITTALRAFNQAQTAYFDIDKITPYAVCMESLFGRETDEITFRLKTRLAWFLEPKDSLMRKEIFNLIGKLYRFRSRLVHGRLDSLPLTKETGNARLELIDQIENAIRRMFQKVLLHEATRNLLSVNESKNDSALMEFLDRLVLDHDSKSI